MIIDLKPSKGLFITVTATQHDDGNPTKIFNFYDALYSGNMVVKSISVPTEILNKRAESINLASHLEDDLKSFLLRNVSDDENLTKLFSKIVSETENIDSISELFNRSDFMRNRKHLSTILRKDQRYGGRSSNTGLLFKFITERNKYAHGKIAYKLPEENLMLQYKIKDISVNAYLEISNLDSFIEAYYHLNSWIHNLKRV